MNLESLRIQNLRSCRDVTIILHPYTCLVGPNGAGKSTILCALNIFFREVQHGGADYTKLSEEDFHKKNTREPITITLTFADLNAEAQQDFATYYRNGKLIITAQASYDEGTRRVSFKQYGERMAMRDFTTFFAKDSDGAKVAELKQIYTQLRETQPELPVTSTKEGMRDALRAHESGHLELCEPIRSEDEFYGFTKGTNLLKKYIQWVYVPAVKDASTEQAEARNTALGQLLERSVRAKIRFADEVNRIAQHAREEYEKLLQKNQGALSALSSSLQERLTTWAHPQATLRLEWYPEARAVTVQEPTARIIAGEHSFEGELCRLGHGLQRSLLLALLQELAVTDDTSGPRLLLGCEEPELYQHPPQARHLFQVFQELTQSNTQVIVSTHSPLFVNGEMFEDVRLIQKDPITIASTASSVTFEQIATTIHNVTGERPIKPAGVRAKLQQTLQANLNEMFFTQRLILVEGLEDIAYITAYLHLSERWDEYRTLGCHIIATDGKSKMIQPLAVATAIGIRTMVVFDADADEYGTIDPARDPEGKRRVQRAQHERDNNAILKLCGITTPNAFPAMTFFSGPVVMWHSNIENIVAEDVGRDDWLRFKEQANAELGHSGGMQKNSAHIAIALQKAWDAGKRSQHLHQLCNHMLQLGSASRSVMTTTTSLPVMPAKRSLIQGQARTN